MCTVLYLYNCLYPSIAVIISQPYPGIYVAKQYQESWHLGCLFYDCRVICTYGFLRNELEAPTTANQIVHPHIVSGCKVICAIRNLVDEAVAMLYNFIVM